MTDSDHTVTKKPENPVVRRLQGKACVWGRCNGTQGPDGRCDRCGSKRP